MSRSFIRTPSPKKALKAATTGRVKRAAKKAVNPYYGKKGMGVADPKRAAYNYTYSRTSTGTSDSEGGTIGCLLTVAVILALFYFFTQVVF